MAIDDELERSAAFDEFLRTSSSPASSHACGVASEAISSSLHDGEAQPVVDCEAKAGVIRLLHEVFRTPGVVAPEIGESLPKAVGRFTIQKLLGRGAFGCVYLAHDPILRRLVALKVIHEHLLSDEGARRRVLREREVMARLQHPNIVPVWEAGEERGLLYIASEYCPGPTLAQWLADRRQAARAPQGGTKSPSLTIRQSAEWIYRLADAVHHSHERGVIHRDLKPGNVLLEPRPSSIVSDCQEAWSPRLTDFGLAKYFHSAKDETRTGLFVGSLEYASPEQVRGQTDNVGPASDVFSLGVLLFELLTGVLPHKTTSDYELARKICDHDVVFTKEQRRQLPRDLQAITLRALQRVPANRYGSAAELRDDLQRYLNNQFVLARTVPVLERWMRWARFHPTVAVSTSLCIVFGLLLLGSLMANNLQLDRQRATAQQLQRRAEQSERLAQEVGYRANMRLAYEAWEKNNWVDALKGLERAATQSPTLLGAEWHWLKDELAGYQRFAPNEEAINAIAYQPSRGSIITTGDSGKVRWWDPASRRQLRELEGKRGAHALALSPDEEILVVPYSYTLEPNSNSMQLWDLKRNMLKECPLHFHDATIESAEFSPDGKWLASGPRYDPVMVTNLHTGASFTLPSERRNRQLAFSPDSRRIAILSDLQVITIHDLNSREVVQSIEVADHTVKSFTWLPQRELLAANCATIGDIQLFSALTGKLLGVIETDLIGEVMAASRDGRHLAVTSGGGRLQLLEVPGFSSATIKRTKKIRPVSIVPETRPLQLLNGFITDVEFLNASQLAAADEDGNLICFDALRRGHKRIAGPGAYWRNVCWHDDDTLTIYSRTTPPQLWSLRDGKPRAATQSHSKIASGSRSSKIRVPAPLQVIHSADGTLTAGFAHTGEVWLSDANGERVRFKVQANRGNVTHDGEHVTADIVLAADNSLLFATGDNNRLTAWRTEDGSLAWEEVMTNSGVTLELDPATKRLFLGGGFETLRVFDADSGELINELSGGNSTKSLLVDSINQRLLSGHVDGTLRIRDLALTQRPTVHRGHSATIIALSQTPDGRTIVTGDKNGAIRMWQADGQPYGLLYESRLPDGEVHSFAWSPSGKKLAAVVSGADGESEIVYWETRSSD